MNIISGAWKLRAKINVYLAHKWGVQLCFVCCGLMRQVNMTDLQLAWELPWLQCCSHKANASSAGKNYASFRNLYSFACSAHSLFWLQWTRRSSSLCSEKEDEILRSATVPRTCYSRFQVNMWRSIYRSFDSTLFCQVSSTKCWR